MARWTTILSNGCPQASHHFLDELEIEYDEQEIEYDEQEDYVVIKHAALFTSTIMSKLLARPNVKLFNAVTTEDLIVKGRRAKVVVSSCGHDGPMGATGVKRLRSVGMIKSLPGMKALDMNTAEDAIGPTFGAMMISGQKAAHLALKALGLPNALDGKSVGSLHSELILAAADSSETDSPTEEVKTESNIWDDGSEDINPFGGGKPRYRDRRYRLLCNDHAIDHDDRHSDDPIHSMELKMEIPEFTGRTLRDVMRLNNPANSELQFGGMTVVFGGDFRQILPVIPKGSRQDVVNASIKWSYTFDNCTVLKLTSNMRLKSGEDIGSAIRCRGDIVLNVASSSIASLLMSGDRTAHSRFVIPINCNEDSVCSISPNSDLGALLRQTKLIIWDEAPMMHMHAFEALDMTLRDVMRLNNPANSELQFGGMTVVFGGHGGMTVVFGRDFRQILPVIPKGSRQDVVNASINRSYIFDNRIVLKLTSNMRLKSGGMPREVLETKEFAKWILKVGNETLSEPGEAIVGIPEEICIKEAADPIQAIADFNFPDLMNNLDTPS
nr:thiamine thiazole synthase, chloroplastic-like [Tanacetum cinerariifolium]